MDRWTSLIGRIRPYSFSALSMAVACIVLAAVLRLAFGFFGVNLLFATYYPAILIVAMLAGVPAGIFSILATIVVVWWAFVPPYFVFTAPSAGEIANDALFAVSSGSIVVLAQMYRTALQRLRQKDDERDLLLKELEHRGRNTYAVVESIVRNTLVNDRASADAIAGRVCAVSSANDLVNQSDTKTVRLKALLASEFAPNAEARLRTSGPNIELSADAARKLGLVCHELTTNAMKHGALARPEGRVIASWQAAGDKVHLSWREENGPAVSPPQREGFGTTIVTQSLKSLDGDISFAFNPDGLCCDMTFGYR